MKIVHVVATLDPAAGGPPQVAVRLSAAQAALGHDVHLVYQSVSTDKERVERQLERVPHRGLVHFHPLVQRTRFERLFPRPARRLLQALAQDAQFVHIHGVWGSLLRLAADVARRGGIPYCFRPAGMLDPWSLAQKRFKKRLALALGYRTALDGAAFIHTLNADEERLIGPLHLDAPCVVLPNGVFIEEIVPLPAPGTFRAAYPALGQNPYVLFLSRLHHKKGLDLLAQAFVLLAQERKDVDLVVAGPEEGAGPDFEARLTRAGLRARVHIVGPLYGRDKLAALVDAACFCLPSRQEGFSVAITEAMACSVPVVISEACHFPEVSRVGAGIVVPLEAAALAAALQSFVNDPVAAARAGALGAALVREHFTWGEIAKRTISCYRSAASDEMGLRSPKRS